jgi:hypothetical protein
MAEQQPARLSEIRDRLHAALDEMSAPPSPIDLDPTQVRELAGALLDVERAIAIQAQRGESEPGVHHQRVVEHAAAAVWNATQEVGASTTVGDAAVAALREALA